jgi:HSP20 family protein
LPGMDENSIDVKFADGTLTIKGEKRDEREEKKKNFHLAERRYGSFQRSFSVPGGVDADRIEANFKNGVLMVTLPKTLQARKNEKKIPVKQT